jgi:signal transduction histidine kinase
VEKRAGMEARVIGDPQLPLTGKVSEELYAITLEALNNVLKHAETDAVTVEIRSNSELLTLEISDNGKGFDLQNEGNGGGIGLISMQERATRLGGKLDIESAPNQGTTVKATIPINRNIVSSTDQTENSE